MPNQSTSSTADKIEPLFAPIPDALRIGGFKRAKMYQLLGDGCVRAVKCGTRTLIDLRSLRAYLDGLPEAQIRPQGRRQKPSDSQRNTANATPQTRRRGRPRKPAAAGNTP